MTGNKISVDGSFKKITVWSCRVKNEKQNDMRNRTFNFKRNEPE